jgi:NAD(P)-dependent dehydrogenase (short-subunit alcohol dehydrogenase family)
MDLGEDDMAGRLHDRVAIVTGGGDGIGRGIVRRFAAEGAKVLVAELNEETGPKVAKECESEFGADVRFLKTDASDKGDNVAMIDFAKDTWGTVDVLVNNAWGNGGGLGRVEHKTDDEMWRGLSMGFMGPFWAMQHVLPIMKAQGRGNVVNICSLNGVNAHMGTVQYNAAKEALRSASRTAAREWAAWQIRVNIICPAAKTAASRQVFLENPELERSADNDNPMKRMGDPDQDIAPVALFLASDDARYVTGNTLFVDGGAHINGSTWAPDLGD